MKRKWIYSMAILALMGGLLAGGSALSAPALTMTTILADAESPG